MKRAVVTGGAGFLGSHLCDRLIAEGCEVICFDNLCTGNVANIEHLLGNPRFRFVQYDVTNYLFVSGPLDFVFHLASPASPTQFTTMAIQIMKVNGLGVHKALGLARAKGARLFLASTSEVYGDPLVHPQPESYLGNVNTIGVRGVYDESKRFAEAMAMAYHRYHGVEVRIARIFNTYGERMRLDDGRVVPNFICQALAGEPLTIYGNGTQTRSFCYRADLIEGFWRLVNSDCTGPMNLGNPTEWTMLAFANEILRLTGSHSSLKHVPMLTEDEPKKRRPDISLATESLGWVPTVALETGMRSTIADFAARMVG